jgi:propionate CoA-transferase
MEEMDQYGNVNVSKFGPRIAGAGGFINITQSTKTVVFCGTLTASGLKVGIGNGRLKIINEGKIRKLVQKVEHITFSGDYGRSSGQRILYVTERAVFELRPEGVTLTEIAPGVDLQKDVLNLMDFRPLIASDLRQMDPRIFEGKTPMGIKDEILNGNRAENGALAAKAA